MEQQGGNEDKIRELEARVRRLEHQLGLKWVEIEGGASEEPPAQGVAGREQVKAAMPGSLLSEWESEREAGSSAPAAEAAPEVLAPASLTAEPAAGGGKDDEQRGGETPVGSPRAIDWAGLEQRVGQRWASVVGAVLFVIGMGLLFLVAWRRGWFVAIPPWGRCSAGAAVGMVMLGAGEWVRGRLSAWAAIGLSAAGLGTVYVSAYAAYAMFHLIDSAAGFGVLSAVALLGIGVSARSGFASVGVLALVCGYATPFLIETVNPSPWVLPVHLIVLLALACGLSAWKGPAFVAVRVAAQFATVSIGTIWALQGVGQRQVGGSGPAAMPLEAVLTLLGGAWALVHAEAWRAVTRWAVREDGSPFDWASLAANAARGAIVGALATGVWVLGVGVVVVQDGAYADLDYVVPLALAAASAAVAWRLTPDVRVMLQSPATLAQQMSCVMAWAALGLLPTAAALALSGWLRLAVWGSMAVVAAVAARRTAIWTLALYGAMVLMLVTGQLVLRDSWRSEVLGVGTVVSGIYFSRWMACAAIVAGAWLGLARLVGVGAGDVAGVIWPAWRLGLARLAAVVGVILAYGLWAHDRTQTQSLAVVMPLLTAGLLLARGWWPGLWVDRAAAVGSLVAVTVWISAYGKWAWLDHPAPLLLHPGLWTSLLAGGAVLMAGWLVGEPGAAARARRELLAWAWGIAGTLVFLSTSLEMSRIAKRVFVEATARSGAVSVWWAVLGIGLIVLGFAIRRPWPRRVGLGVLGLALAKMVVYDMSEVVLEWRAAAFLVLGLVMLGVGLLYARVAKRMGATV